MERMEDLETNSEDELVKFFALIACWPPVVIWYTDSVVSLDNFVCCFPLPCFFIGYGHGHPRHDDHEKEAEVQLRTRAHRLLEDVREMVRVGASGVRRDAAVADVPLPTWPHKLLPKANVTTRFYHLPARLERLCCVGEPRENSD